MHRLHRLPALLLTLAASALALAACDSASGPPPVGSIATSGTLPASAVVGSSVTVRLAIETESGDPMEGVQVSLEAASGGGSVQPDTAETDVDGSVSAVWTLGTAAGDQTLRVTARETTEILTIRAEPGEPVRLVLLTAQDVTGTVGQVVESPVRVRLEDRFENPVPDRRVTFRPRTEADGVVEQGGVTTDEQGTAGTTWTLGSGAGFQWLDAHSQGVALVSVRADARADAPAVLELLSGDDQAGRVGRALSEPLTVRVTDAFENPVGGIQVVFTPEAGGGSADPAGAGTDPQGRASAVWTLGPGTGAWTLEASVEGIQDPVTFRAQATPGLPAALTALSGDGQEGYAGAALPEPLTVRVTDEFENPVPFAVVTFQPAEGSGAASPATATSDGQGQASTTWTLGTSPGAHTLEVRAGDAPPVTFAATAGSRPPAEIRALSGDGQSAQVNSQLPEALTVQVVDVDGNPVQGAVVELAATSGGGSPGQATLTTDASGQASTTWTLGTQAGTQTLEARVAQVEAPAVFTATATPGAAVSLVAASGDQQSAPAGQALADPVAVRARDEFGNGVSGVQVSFQVTGGGGSVDPAAAATDASGLAAATWTLGPQAGQNTLQASADGLGTVTFTASATSAGPAAVQVLSGDGQTGPVATALPEAVRVLVTDEAQNPLPGVSVEFVPSGDQGEAAPGVAATDENGEAAAVWTLATGAGAQTLEARVDGVDAPAVFAATATPGPPASVSPVSGDGQTGTQGTELEPFVVRVADGFGNPVQGVTVSWSVVQGNGSLTATATSTDAQGRALVRYTTGTSFGEEKVEASAQELEPVTFTALVGNNLTLAGLYVTQAAQPLDGSTPLVADRPGMLRAFVRAGAPNDFTPDVRLEVYQNGSLVLSETLPAGESSVRTDQVEGPLSASWNLELPASMIQPGLAVRAVVDPDNLVGEVDETDNVFPAGGGVRSLDVRQLLPFRARLVPIRIDTTNTVGNANAGNADGYMTDVYAMMPMPDYDVDVRDTFTASIGNTNDFEEWVQMLNDILALRMADDSDRYYYGVIGTGSNAPFCGLGYLGFPASIGQDACGPGTAAHEWGHNWDRLHAPCGDPGGPDPDYPYPEASIGVWGLNPFTGEVRDPATWKDLMSYCGPEWISDYTFEGVMSFRENEAVGAGALRTSAEPSLILWGRITPEGPVLEPAFRAVTRPSLPRESGPYRLLGLAADGAELFRLSFDAAPVDHADGGHRGFAFAVPESEIPVEALDRLVLETPGLGSAVRARSAALLETEPELSARRAGAGRVRVTWSPALAPLAVVRNPATGAILSFGRGGEAVVATGAAELEVELAGGVGGVRRTVPVR